MAKKAKGDGKVDGKRDKWLARIADEDKAHKIFRQRAKDADEAYLSYQENETLPKFPVYYTTIQLIHGKIYGHPPKPDIRKRNPSSPLSQSQQPAQAVPPQPPQSQMAPQAGAAGGIQQGVQPGQTGAVPGQPGAAIAPPSAILQNVGNLTQGQPLNPPGDQAASNNILAMCMERALAYTIDTTSFDLDMSAAVLDFLKAGCGATKVEMETELEEIPVVGPQSDKVTGQVKVGP